MKKLNIIFTLIISSFFLLSSNVSADTTTYEVSQSDVDYISSEDFINFREQVIEYCNENNLNYIIAFKSGSFRAQVFDNSLYNLYLDGGLYSDPLYDYQLLTFYNNNLTVAGSGSSNRFSLVKSGVLNYQVFLDTNIENFSYMGSTSFIIKYNDLEQTINSGDKVPSLYEFINKEEPDIYEEEKKKISNFYILIIDKIKLLTNYIATDYIILSALVIFIFVAVIGLVRRLE